MTTFGCVGVTVAVLLGASSGPAWAGSAECLWKSLSTYTRDNSALLFEQDGVAGLKKWTLTPADKRSALACPGASQNPAAAAKALHYYAAREAIGEKLNRDYDFNSGGAGLTWDYASPDFKAAIRKYMNEADQKTPVDADTDAFVKRLLSEQSVQYAASRHGFPKELYVLIMEYYFCCAHLEEAESEF